MRLKPIVDKMGGAEIDNKMGGAEIEDEMGGAEIEDEMGGAEIEAEMNEYTLAHTWTPHAIIAPVGKVCLKFPLSYYNSTDGSRQ